MYEDVIAPLDSSTRTTTRCYASSMFRHLGSTSSSSITTPPST